LSKITKSTQTNYSESEVRFDFNISRMPNTLPHDRYRGEEFAKTNKQTNNLRKQVHIN